MRPVGDPAILIGARLRAGKFRLSLIVLPLSSGVILTVRLRSSRHDGKGPVIWLDALDLPTMETAMKIGVRAACRPGVLRITAGNYGGKLGKFHLQLHRLLAD